MANPLLTHYRAMQDMAANYLEPTGDYTNRDGVHAEDDGNECPPVERLFIGDMIYMLDGPEQRAAQAHAEFDYLAESARTASDKFYGVNGRKRLVIQRLSEFGTAANHLDRYKKLFFYGENLEKKVFADDTALDDKNGGHIIETLMELCEGMSQDDAEQLFHAILGIATEAGELTDVVLSAIGMRVKPDPVNLAEEAGDLLWYIAMLLRTLNVSFDYAMRKNIAKLRERYPSKFTSEEAHNRDLDREHDVLSSYVTQESFDKAFPRKQSSPAMSSLAASVLARTKPGAPMPDISQLIADARSLAASVLSQDETPGQDETPKRKFFGQDKN